MHQPALWWLLPLPCICPCKQVSHVQLSNLRSQLLGTASVKTRSQARKRKTKFKNLKIFYFKKIVFLSSRGGLEVEPRSDNRTLSILVDQSPLGACILYGTIGPAVLCKSWMCVICVCKLKDYINKITFTDVNCPHLKEEPSKHWGYQINCTMWSKSCVQYANTVL